MNIKNADFSIEINEEDGNVCTLNNGIKELIMPPVKNKTSLITIRFRNIDGKAVDIKSSQAGQFTLNKHEEKNSIIITMLYEKFAGFDIKMEVQVRIPHKSKLTYWRLNVDNSTDMFIDWIESPEIIVPDDLSIEEGAPKIVWPGMEGALIDDMGFREKSWLKYNPIEYPNKGWEGYYPGPCPIQMMAYYDKAGGLYFAAHDSNFNIKAMECHKYNDGIKLEIRVKCTGYYQKPIC